MKNSKNNRISNQINVATLNVRTLSSDAHYLELENALSKINYDILGLCEIKRTGQETLQINGNVFHYIGFNNRRGSVGFIIKSKWKNHIKLFKDFSDRVTVVELSINKKETLTIIQTYAPTSAASDEEMNEFYDDLQQACNEFKKSTKLIIMGDFNSKIGMRQIGEDDVLGSFGYGIRNERGAALIRFARSNEFFIANTLFKKRLTRKWTWKSPDQRTMNEIDFVLVRKSDKRAVKNVETMQRFEFSTDHRLVPLKQCFSNFCVLRHSSKKKFFLRHI
jgi:exonuclease III